jgi:hypothetical protein
MNSKQFACGWSSPGRLRLNYGTEASYRETESEIFKLSVIVLVLSMQQKNLCDGPKS